MKVHIANYQNKIGGGWTQARYLADGLNNCEYTESDVYFITGASMVNYADVDKAKKDNKKIVLRVDNHLLPSRNRNTGMTRMVYFAQKADLIVYQSSWAKDYLRPLIGDGVVILNGVDTAVFNTRGRVDNTKALYVRSSRIAEKGWERARYWYSRNNSAVSELSIVGKFSYENVQYNFDFINNEKFTFMGEQPRANIASLMKQHKYFLYSYFMDACSNTLLEARASGMQIVDVYGDLKTGGAPEIMQLQDLSKERMIQEYKNYLENL